MTQSFEILARAYAEESTQSAKNAMHALKADKEKRPVEARLFRALASAEQVHANKALMLLRGRISDTDTNLQNALAEVETAVEAYRDGIMTAATEKAHAIESTLIHFMKTAMNHKSLLSKQPDTDLHVCQICGFIAQNDIPDHCPVCRAVPQQFETMK